MSKRASYPVVGLSKAIEDIKQLWKDAQHATLTAEAAVKSMGYKSLNGAARSRLAALKHFGLTEEAGKEQVRVSPVGKIIAVHPDGPEKTKAIQDAGRSPKLFQDLLPSYVNASDGVIRGFLVTNKGYSDEAAKAAIRAFRDTVAYAKLAEPSVDPDPDGDDILDSEDDGGDVDEETNDRKIKKIKVPPAANTIVDEVSFKLSPSSKVEIVFTSDKPTTQEDFDLMMQMLNIQKLAFPKAADVQKERQWVERYADSAPPPKAQPPAKRTYPCEAVWANKDHDQPVTVTGELGERDGRLFYSIEEGNGGIPADEVKFQEGN